jgi:hypothetical protein
MSLIKLSLSGNNLIIQGQGEFGWWHSGWGRENRKPFFSVDLLQFTPFSFHIPPKLCTLFSLAFLYIISFILPFFNNKGLHVTHEIIVFCTINIGPFPQTPLSPSKHVHAILVSRLNPSACYWHSDHSDSSN